MGMEYFLSASIITNEKERKQDKDAWFIGFHDSIENLSRKLSNSIYNIIVFFVKILSNIYVIVDTDSMRYSNNWSLVNLHFHLHAKSYRVF